MKEKILAGTIALLMVAVMMMPMVAASQTSDTQAVVTGAGTPPIFEEKFELNDDGDLPNHVTPGTQVMPIPDGNKEVCVYVVVRDPNGAADINRIWMSVVNQNGVEVANGDTINIGEISELTHTETCTATQAAVGANLMLSPRKTEIDDHVYASEWRMWKFCFDLTHCDISGTYTVTANANDHAGGTGTITNDFEYLSIKELAIDFNLIDYGTIVPGIKQIVSGDEDENTPFEPTVRNRANDPFKLKISAENMQGNDPNNVILATNLDAHVYGEDANGNTIDENLYLDSNGIEFNPIINTCTIEKIDFSLMQDPICEDTYRGTITLEPIAP